MKNLFSSLLFLLASNFVFGQIEWVGNHDFTEAASDIFLTSKNQYVLVHGNGTGFTVFDSNGLMVFQNSFMDYRINAYTQISDIIELPDSSIVFTAGIIDCDVFIERFHRFDKNWIELIPPYTDAFDTSGPAAKFSDNTLAFAPGDIWGNNIISRLDIAANELWKKDIPNSNIQDLVITPEDTLLVATAQGLTKFTAAGDIVSTDASLVFDRIEILQNNNYLALSGDVLYIYAPDFSVLSSFDTQTDSIADVAFTHNEIAVLTATPAILRLDYSLNLLSTTPLAGENQAFTAVAFKDDGFFVGGTEGYGNQQHGSRSSFIKEFYEDGSTLNTGKDIAINEVTYTCDGLAFRIDWEDINFAIIFEDLLLNLENKGSSTIEEVTIKLEIPDYNAWAPPCNNIRFYEKTFSNLSLLPGATTQLDWEYQAVRFGQNPDGQQVDLCFWATLPDRKLDSNHLNDMGCTELVMVVNGTNEITLTNVFSHNFNPIADELYIEMQTDFINKTAKSNIFNAAGQLVYATDIEDLRQTLQLQGLPDGTYFLQIIHDGRVGWGKFAKY